MRIILLVIIKIYWFLIPPKSRNNCLFKKNCSNYVFEISKKEGLISGLKAFLYRYKHCRPGYYIVEGKKGKLLISARNEVFDEKDIIEKIFERKKK